jgi:hypothetical protein
MVCLILNFDGINGINGIDGIDEEFFPQRIPKLFLKPFSRSSSSIP